MSRAARAKAEAVIPIALATITFLITSAVCSAAEDEAADAAHQEHAARETVTIWVERFDAMCSFYAATLTTPFATIRRPHGEFWARADTGAIQVLLCLKPHDAADAKRAPVHVLLPVPDVAGAYRAGLAAGGAAVQEPAQRGGGWTASLRDPDGNTVELETKP